MAQIWLASVTDNGADLCSGSEALPDAVRDVDFSPTHQNRVLASTCEDGSCVLWEWSSRRRLFTLQQPAGASACKCIYCARIDWPPCTADCGSVQSSVAPISHIYEESRSAMLAV